MPRQRQVPAPTEVPLPPERAFVVQLRPQSDPAADLFIGRAEHIASGDVARFSSAEDLIAFLRRVIAPTTAPAQSDPSALPAESQTNRTDEGEVNRSQHPSRP